MSLRDVCAYLRIRHREAPRWIEQGFLKAVRSESRTGAVSYLIEFDALQKFCKEHRDLLITRRSSPNGSNSSRNMSSRQSMRSSCARAKVSATLRPSSAGNTSKTRDTLKGAPDLSGSRPDKRTGSGVHGSSTFSVVNLSLSRFRQAETRPVSALGKPTLSR